MTSKTETNKLSTASARDIGAATQERSRLRHALHELRRSAFSDLMKAELLWNWEDIENLSLDARCELHRFAERLSETAHDLAMDIESREQASKVA